MGLTPREKLSDACRDPAFAAFVENGAEFLSAVNFDLSEKDHSPRFRVFGVFTQPGSMNRPLGYVRVGSAYIQ
jgi:hypothetical protein